MDHLAKAVVECFAFLALSDDDVIDADDAMRVMESLTAELRQCDEAERHALRNAALAWHDEQGRSGAGSEVLGFYEQFMENLD